MSHEHRHHNHEPDSGLAALGWASLGLGFLVWAIVCEVRYQVARHRETKLRVSGRPGYQTAPSARGRQGPRKI